MSEVDQTLTIEKINEFKDRVTDINNAIELRIYPEYCKDNLVNSMKQLNDFQDKCGKFINTCETIICIKNGGRFNQDIITKFEEYEKTELVIDYYEIENRFKDLYDAYRRYKLDHMIFDIIFKGEEDG